MMRALAVALGRETRDERLRRGWRLQDLASRSGMSVASVHRLESGETSSLEGYARVAAAFGWQPAFQLHAPRLPAAGRDADPVHAAFGEIEAAHFRGLGYEVRLDEPYQHFQFAGRADSLVVDMSQRSLLHLENKTGFPDIQGFLGSWNAKRAYLPADVADRFGVPARGWRSVTNVVVALWSAEVLHALRLRAETFRTACPDRVDAFAAWWNRAAPPSGVTSSLIVFDPLTGLRTTRRRWIGLDRAIHPSTDPRYRGYLDALKALKQIGMA